MPVLHVFRKQGFAYGGVGYKLLLDGKATSKINAGEDLTLPVETGNHTLQLKAGLFAKSNLVEFSVAENQVPKFEISTFGKGFIKAFVEIKQVT